MTGSVDIGNVTLTYRGAAGGVLALKGTSLSVRRGEFAAVVGPSGCGKSSLMKIVTGLVPPDSGDIVIFGDKVRGPVKIAGMAFQNPNLLPWRKVIDNVLLPLEIVEPHRRRFRRDRERYRGEADALLKTVGLDGFSERFPWELSGGMQQRVSLCRALIHQPALLMLDEPFAALDAFTREELWCVLSDLWQRFGFTVILVTHDLREAAFLADNIHVMSARPGHLLRAAFHRHRPRAAGQDRGGAQAMSSTLERLSPWLFTIAMFVLWELMCRIFKIDTFVLPAPSQIFQAIGQYWLPLGKNAFVTLWTTLAGFALAVAFGIVLGIIVGWSRTIYRGLYPVMIGFNSIPKVAVVPILIIWFGIGIVPAVLTAFLISFFPIVVNVATGLATMEPELEDVLRALGAKKLDIMLKVGIPRTQPYLFGSLKIAITLAFVGAVMSETIGANAGLGHLMVQAGSNFQMPLVFACLIGLAVEGIAMYAVFAYVEAYFTGWAFRSSMSAAA